MNKVENRFYRRKEPDSSGCKTCDNGGYVVGHDQTADCCPACFVPDEPASEEKSMARICADIRAEIGGYK